MAMGENDGYDTILHKISRYDTASKRTAVFNGQQSKINVAFSLTPSHAFASISFGSIRTRIRNLALIDFSSVQTDAVHRNRRPLQTIEPRWRCSMRAMNIFSLTFECRPHLSNVVRKLMKKWSSHASNVVDGDGGWINEHVFRMSTGDGNFLDSRLGWIDYVTVILIRARCPSCHPTL